jgi:hypothetical protein
MNGNDMKTYDRGAADYRRGYIAGYNTGYQAGGRGATRWSGDPEDWPGPDESLFCSCGAQWHGVYTMSEIIKHHQGDAHLKISHDEFTQMGFACRKTARHKCDKGAKPYIDKRAESSW